MKLKNLQTIVVLLISLNLAFTQSKYYFEYDIIYNTDYELVFVDTNKQISYEIDYNQNYNKVIGRKIEKNTFSVSQHDIRKISLNKIKTLLSKKSFEFRDLYPFKIQQFEDHMVAFEFDDNEVDLEPICLNHFFVNDIPFIIAFDDIYLISTKKGVVGLFEDQFSKSSKKVKFSKKNKDQFRVYIKEDFPEYKPECSKLSESYSKFSLSNNYASFFDENKNEWRKVILNGYIEGFSIKESKESETSYVIDNKTSLNSIDELGGKFYVKPDFDLNIDNQTIYKHLHKNTLAEINVLYKDGKIELSINGFEPLIPIKTNKNQTVFVGENIVAGSYKGQPVLYKGKEIMIPLTDLKANELSLIKKIDFNSFRPKLVKVKNGYQLFDNTKQFKLIEGTYDTIQFIEHYMLCRKGSKDIILNSKLENLDIMNGYSVGLHYSCPQLVKADSNKIKYLTYDNTIQNEAEPFTQIIGCGHKDGPFFHEFRKKEDGVFFYKSNRFDHLFSDDFKEYFYQSDKLSPEYTFNFDADSIVGLVNKSKTIEDHDNYFDFYFKNNIVQNHTFVYYKNGKSGLAHLTYHDHQNKTCRVSIIYSFDFIPIFQYNGPKHPIMFEYKGLYGYVGLNQEPFAKELNQFDGAFARYTLPNGKKGWIDRDGRRIE